MNSLTFCHHMHLDIAEETCCSLSHMLKEGYPKLSNLQRSKCPRLVAVQRPSGQAPLCLPSLSRHWPAEVPQLQRRRCCSGCHGLNMTASRIWIYQHISASDDALKLKELHQGSRKHPIVPPAHLILLWKTGKQALMPCCRRHANQ